MSNFEYPTDIALDVYEGLTPFERRIAENLEHIRYGWRKIESRPTRLKSAVILSTDKSGLSSIHPVISLGEDGLYALSGSDYTVLNALVEADCGFDLFRPYVSENKYLYRCANLYLDPQTQQLATNPVFRGRPASYFDTNGYVEFSPLGMSNDVTPANLAIRIFQNVCNDTAAINLVNEAWDRGQRETSFIS